MKVKWVKAAYFLAGVLLPIPLNLLVEYLNDLRSMMFDFHFTLALLILVHAVYLILGAYIGLYNLVESHGVKGRLRIRWPKFAMGAGLITLGIFIRLSYYGGVAFTYKFALGNDLFNDRFFIWYVLAGFLMANAFERVPLKEEAAADGPHPDEKAVGEQPGA